MASNAASSVQVRVNGTETARDGHAKLNARGARSLALGGWTLESYLTHIASIGVGGTGLTPCACEGVAIPKQSSRLAMNQDVHCLIHAARSRGGCLRLDHGSDVPVFENQALVLRCFSKHNIHHCPGQVVSAHDL